jgi:hypothetical protein
VTTVRRAVTRLFLVTCLAAGSGLATAAPAAAADGASVRIQNLPDQFTAGGPPITMAAVTSKRGGDCQKVRWSMILQVTGMTLDQVRIERIEQNAEFAVDEQRRGDAARLTDVQLDPGTLCRDKTVTAQYRVNFAENVADGQVTFTAEAYDDNLRLLERASATRAVVGGVGATPTPTPTESAEAPPPTEPTAGPTGAAAEQPVVRSRVDVPIPPIGFIVGAVMVFLGVGMLLQVRRRNRRRPRPGALDGPTMGWPSYGPPRRRRA